MAEKPAVNADQPLSLVRVVKHEGILHARYRSRYSQLEALRQALSRFAADVEYELSGFRRGRRVTLKNRTILGVPELVNLILLLYAMPPVEAEEKIDDSSILKD